jgi:transposase-like protein
LIPTPRPSGRWTPEYARMILEAFENSELSMAEFARRRGVCTQRIRWWQKQMHRRPQSSPPHLVELVVTGSPEPIAPAADAAVVVRVRCPSGHVLELAHCSPEQALFAVFRALQLTRC